MCIRDRLSAVLSPEWEGAQITWSSSGSNAAVVTPEGVVTNLYPGAGTFQATVTASWNGLTASCVVYCEPASLVGTVAGAEAGLNVRSGPGTDYAVIGGLSNGTWVVVLSQQNGWYQVLYRNSSDQAAIGYVSADYLTPVSYTHLTLPTNREV